MVVGVVARQKLQRVEGQAVPAVVVHGLQTRDEEEEHGLARRHACQELRDSSADCVKNESLNRVIVQRPERIGDV